MSGIWDWVMAVLSLRDSRCMAGARWTEQFGLKNDYVEQRALKWVVQGFTVVNDGRVKDTLRKMCTSLEFIAKSGGGEFTGWE